MILPVRGLAPVSAASGRRSSLYADLFGYWKLDEISGSRLDSSGNGLTLTDNNTVTSAAGKLHGLAAQFTIATSESLSRANETAIQAGDVDWTWACWIYPDSVGLAHQYFISKGGFAVDYELELSGADLIGQYWNGSYSQVFTIGSAVPAGAWSRIVFWHDSVANTLNLQLNNDTVRSAATVSVATTTTDPLYFGRRGSGGSFYGGRIGDMAFWKKALTSAERLEHWNGGSGFALY